MRTKKLELAEAILSLATGVLFLVYAKMNGYVTGYICAPMWFASGGIWLYMAMRK